MKRILTSFFFGVLVAGTAIGVIAYSRGVRLNMQTKTVDTTGILSASSYPDKASLYIDGKLVSATSASLSLVPGWYNVKIAKDGYQPWEKRIRVQGEVVSLADALLVPINPSGIRPLTITGVSYPSLSNSLDRVAFLTPPELATASSSIVLNSGIYVLDLKNGPLGSRSDPRLIYPIPTGREGLIPKITWSPDDKEILYTQTRSDKNKDTIVTAVRIEVDSGTPSSQDVTLTVTDVREIWKIEAEDKKQTSLMALPNGLKNFLATNSANLSFSPNENKILYLASNSASLSPIISPPLPGSNSTPETRTVLPNNYYVYDRKEDRNYFLTDQKTVPHPGSLKWYNDSKNIVIVENDTIYIVEYDGTNKRAIYAGPFEDSIIYPWGSGGKIVIMTNLNKQKASSNLYEIDLR
ncbi:hypothetical protein A3D77_03315 [Candidatus Gottesmanbacteria bacterium RIFCSPHIGHO2_02_FULL_39_11]|uniref:PEGA domain-containing protein n=1 Tax=Candidatus Gottesmanbacteria bacterium RIFCSPHIGHO2_02_FULL_39_11 TaxID=1798382 RepID=A0A1F5ZNH3_9BACT|nr:MAG: hypothetical protein A3D77_03315 [Candidatus Gottesmanbacteria bacterium RIFCSPHIGHO2_02_FULL_39_11]